MKLSELKIDNVNGLGVTPNNMEIDYFGVKVKMTPSMYLKLAAPLEHEKSVDFFREKVKNNEGISSPTLYITVPDNWKKEEFSDDDDPYVSGHEGRNRMTAIIREEGDDPIEVHIFFSGRVEWRNRHITKRIIDELNKGIRKENSKDKIKGPIFK